MRRIYRYVVPRRAGFNSRTLGRVRRSPHSTQAACQRFNSRTLGRVRHAISCPLHSAVAFQFTHPGKGATAGCVSFLTSAPSFNSRTLGRVRLGRPLPDIYYVAFQFTHPGKGATSRSHLGARSRCVSIHAPWEGCDNKTKLVDAIQAVFQFTHPGKGAT